MKKIISIAFCFFLSCVILTCCSTNGEPFEEKNYTSNTEIDEIKIDVRDRQIEVSLSDDEHVHIKYYENSKEYYDIKVSDENVLMMTGVSDKNWTDYIGIRASDDNRKISLQIPNAYLDNFTLSTTNEEVSLSALAVTGDINISSNGGDVVFEELDVGNALNLTVKNGDISGVVVGGYDDFAIQTEIKKGETNLPNKSDGEKTLDITCNNGDANIEFTKK